MRKDEQREREGGINQRNEEQKPERGVKHFFPEGVAQGPLHRKSRERTLLPQMCPLNSRNLHWGVPDFYPRELRQKERPEPQAGNVPLGSTLCSPAPQK